MGREVVTILHPGASTGVDDYGVPLSSDSAAEQVTALAVAPGGSDENNRYQATVSVDLRVFLPAGTVVESTAKMVVRGVTYEVVGESADWRSPFSTWTPGIAVALERAE
jgi:hypothetical protein